MIKHALERGVILQPHQEKVLEKLKDSDAILLFHGLGSGKTLSSIAATEGDDVTVVAPASLRSNYKKELDKFVATPSDKSKYNVISYEGAIAGKEGFGDALVVDEIHRISNASSGRSKKIMDMASDYNKRIALTGTPIVNHPSDLAPIIRFLSPDDRTVPLDRKGFENKFIGTEQVPVGFFNRLRGIKPGVRTTAVNTDDLRKAIAGKIHYHSMNAEDYPTVEEEIIKIPMSRNQTDIYNTVVRKANPAIAYKVKKNMPLSKSEMAKMNFFMSAARQTSNVTDKYGDMAATPKMEQVVQDLVNEYERDRKFKGVVYSNYIGSGLDVISDKLKGHGISHAKFTGEMNDKEKADAVKKYNSNKINALLISSAGAEGLDLKGTNMVQVVEPHWNKAKIDQVIGRAARYKSHAHLPEDKRNVKVKKYQSVLKRGTSADEYLEQMSIDKDKLNQAFLEILKEEGVR